jgi:hypothetical protein
VGAPDLKQQWGVGHPAQAPSDKQALQFTASFNQEMGVINGHLQYTSANAEAAPHQGFAARRDALYAAYQAALAKIDRSDPSKAKADIDKVLADGKALCAEVAKFRKEAEHAKKDWQAKEHAYDEAVHHVEELEAWGHAAAPALRTDADAIRSQVNQRQHAQATQALAPLQARLKPVYAEYLK